MNISPVSNYRNQTSFGMAFKKPSSEVSKFFEDVITSLNPEERAKFVQDVGKRVQRAKLCPVPIEHTVEKNRIYGAKVGNTIYSYNPETSTNRSKSILEVMDEGIKAAENQHDINLNTKRLNDILNA